MAGSVTLDFYLRLYWTDNRFNMPMLWNKLSKTVRSNGFEITRILENNSSCPFWLPDIRFHDAASVDYIVEVLVDMIKSIIFHISIKLTIALFSNYCRLFALTLPM